MPLGLSFFKNIQICSLASSYDIPDPGASFTILAKSIAAKTIEKKCYKVYVPNCSPFSV